MSRWSHDSLITALQKEQALLRAQVALLDEELDFLRRQAESWRMIAAARIRVMDEAERSPRPYRGQVGQ